MSIDSKFLEYLTAKLLPREHLSHGRSNELSEAASKLLPRQGWRQKFSEKYIRFRLEKEVLNDLPEDDPASQIFERLTKFISDLDDFSSECTVYLPVEGLKLSKRLKLGNVQFIPVTKTFKRNLLRQGKERIFRTSHPRTEQIRRNKNYAAAIEKACSTGCCAVVTVIAERGRAIARIIHVEKKGFMRVTP